jgi:transcription initiation factor TFIIB
MHDKGLSTIISLDSKDYSGRPLNPEERAKLYRLRKWDQRSKIYDSSQRNLAIALNEITAISNKLNLPRNVIETGSMIYRRALQKQLIKGRTIQSIAVASLYIACRQCEVTRTLIDVANAANIPKKEAARNYRFLLKMLDTDVPLTNPNSYISKIVNKLDLKGDTEWLAMKILSKASEMKLTIGRGPNGIAAACLYMSTCITGDKRTQSEIAKEAQVTEVTIRNRYKELTKNLNFTMKI